MRVITGIAKGTRLRTLEGNDVRPTTDRVKEGIFSALQFGIEGRTFLDLFAGSGQMWIEAISRGAKKAVFVDSSKKSLQVVNENIESGELFNSKTWKELVANAQNSKMHFLGLLSDGNVHSHINHLKALIAQAKKEGVKEVRVHALLDGRDVPATSALQYIDEIVHKVW